MTIPGRITAVHAMETPTGNFGEREDFPGDIIRMHKAIGFQYVGRHLCLEGTSCGSTSNDGKGLAHKQIVDDSSLCDMAAADYVLLFRKKGDNPFPIEHPTGLHTYAGERPIPSELIPYKDGPVSKRKIGSLIGYGVNMRPRFWDDVRIDRVLPYKESRDPEDEKHVHPLQLDVIETHCDVEKQSWRNGLDSVHGCRQRTVWSGGNVDAKRWESNSSQVTTSRP